MAASTGFKALITPEEIEAVGEQIAGLIALGKPIEQVIVGVVNLFRDTSEADDAAMIDATRAKILALKLKADQMAGQTPGSPAK